MSDLSKKENDAYSTVNEPPEEEAPSTNDAILLPVFVALIALAGALTVAVVAFIPTAMVMRKKNLL